MTDPIPDAAGDGWIDRVVPARARPFLRLARWDRPIGFWLLMWPGWWGLTLAVPETDAHWPSQALLILFALGAVVMRGAGCTLNDIIDRDIDAAVARTRSRPLPSGQVSLREAWIFLIFQCLLGFVILLTMNGLTIALGVASLGLVAAYPFMKRLTDWPQGWLGLTFNWGAIMGYAAASGTLGLAPVALYLGAVFWTLGYDTIYAHQDREDDALVGVRSSARVLGYQTGPWLIVFYGVSLALITLAGWLASLGGLFYLGMLVAAAHLAWQIAGLDVDRPALCLRLFRRNRDFGALVFVALLLGLWR